MKIGILTLPLHTNYGGILQAYALQTVLERMGHDVVVFDTSKRISMPMWKYPFAFVKRCIRKYVVRKPTRIFYEKWYNETYSILSQHTQRFINKYINRLEIASFSSLQKDDFDVLIVGSDQVWRPMYFCPMFRTEIENAFLSFADTWVVKRIAYAASFGSENWEYNSEQTDRISELIKKFDAVSVRETLGVQMCKSQLNIDVAHVLDPTMLLSKEDYMNLIRASDVKQSRGNLLCYILDETEEKNDIINYIAEQKGMFPFYVNSNIESLTMSFTDCIQPAVESWLRGFYDADFVVTDSFHACVFAILFQKPFIAVGNKERGMARFYSLLDLFGLRQCLITEVSEIKWLEIDWDAIFVTMQQERARATLFLHNALF